LNAEFSYRALLFGSQFPLAQTSNWSAEDSKRFAGMWSSPFIDREFDEAILIQVFDNPGAIAVSFHQTVWVKNGLGDETGRDGNFSLTIIMDPMLYTALGAHPNAFVGVWHMAQRYYLSPAIRRGMNASRGQDTGIIDLGPPAVSTTLSAADDFNKVVSVNGGTFWSECTRTLRDIDGGQRLLIKGIQDSFERVRYANALLWLVQPALRAGFGVATHDLKRDAHGSRRWPTRGFVLATGMHTPSGFRVIDAGAYGTGSDGTTDPFVSEAVKGGLSALLVLQNRISELLRLSPSANPSWIERYVLADAHGVKVDRLVYGTLIGVDPSRIGVLGASPMEMEQVCRYLVSAGASIEAVQRVVQGWITGDLRSALEASVGQPTLRNLVIAEALLSSIWKDEFLQGIEEVDGFISFMTSYLDAANEARSYVTSSTSRLAKCIHWQLSTPARLELVRFVCRGVQGYLGSRRRYPLRPEFASTEVARLFQLLHELQLAGLPADGAGRQVLARRQNDHIAKLISSTTAWLQRLIFG